MEKRRVEIARLDRFTGVRWEPIEMGELRKGNTFRMFEPDTGEPVTDPEGRTEFVCDSDARVDENGVGSVMVGEGGAHLEPRLEFPE